jgi:hypothetical protein
MVRTLSDGPPASRAGLQAVAAASSSQRRLGLVREAAKWCDGGKCVDLGFFYGNSKLRCQRGGSYKPRSCRGAGGLPSTEDCKESERDKYSLEGFRIFFLGSFWF